jgi:hypothetical protein
MKILRVFKYLRVPIAIIICVLLWKYFVPDFSSPPTDYADAVVMVDGELYFVLQKEYKVEWIAVETNTHSAATHHGLMWRYGRDYADSTTYLKTRQIKYGQEIKVFRTQAPLQELQKNIDYHVEIGVSGRIWELLADFYIADNNKVVMTRRFNPKPPRNPTIIIERNGKRISVPYSVSFDKDGNKVIISEPIPEK